ncbi:APC family permease [Mycolicibacterium setense]
MSVNEESIISREAAVADDTSTRRLTGRMGSTELVLSVLAFSAPIVTVSGYIAFAIAAVGQGAPLAWVVATAVLLIFSVGYTTMTQHVPRPGAFYAYITVGLGRIPGVGSAFLATVSYIAILTGFYCFAGLTLQATIQAFGGPTVTWWLLTLLTWAVVSALGHFNIELSAKILSVVMVLEVIMVVIFNVATLAKGGAHGLTMQALDISAFTRAGMAIALLFAFGNFIGFESTALYRDEVKNPQVTVPRATYLSVLFIGLFYAVSAYTLMIAYGSSAGDMATKDPTNMFTAALKQFVAPAMADISLVLVATSAAAGLLSTHNVAARYLFNLGGDRALPSFLSDVHPRHGSPYRASAVVGVVVLVLLAILVLVGIEPSKLVGSFSGIGTMGVLVLMALASLAVILWFARKGQHTGEGRWKTTIAPALAFVSLTAVTLYAVVRFDLLVGGDPGEYLWLLLIPAASFIAGTGVAAHYWKSRPELFARLGRASAQD